MNASAAADVELLGDLDDALRRDELLLHYQPLIDLTAGSATGFEALVRWRHPRLGLLGPSSFVPLAERTGRGALLGSRVLRRACREAASWRKTRPGSTYSLTVNVGGAQIADAGFVEDVLTALQIADLPPSALILDVTETALGAHPHNPDRLNRLGELGVRSALDDFGGGSLAALRALPVTTVKIDRPVVRLLAAPDAARGEVDAARSALRTARALGAGAVAEGVESQDEAERMRALGCDSAQGFLWSAPLPARELARWQRADEARTPGRPPAGRLPSGA